MKLAGDKITEEKEDVENQEVRVEERRGFN